MKYFLVDTLGDLDYGDYCILDKAPEGIGVKYSFLVRGRPIGSDFPSDAKIRMSPDRTGIKLGGLIASTKNFLILHRDVVDVVKEACGDAEIEYLPVSVVNHKGRVQSPDYFIVNPIGTLDCLDPDASEIVYFNDTEKVVRIDRMVIDPSRLEGAPSLFRIKQAPAKYVVDEALADSLTQGGFDNVILTEIDQIPAAE